MGLADTFAREDRVEVKFSDFYNLMKGCTQQEMLMNGVRTRVPHEYMENMMTGKLTDTQERVNKLLMEINSDRKEEST